HSLRRPGSCGAVGDVFPAASAGPRGWSRAARGAPVVRPPPARCPARRQSGHSCPPLSVSRGGIRLTGQGDPMAVFLGWVSVGVGFVVTCIGMGAMLSLGIFLQPMTEAMGWSRTGISTVALLNWLSMGVGAFLWGAASDRFGTRAVVLAGGVLLGIGLVT